MNFDPNNLCLESPEFGRSVPLVLHSSGHLLLPLVNSSNTLDQYTVVIDYQNSSSSVVNGFQKRGEQTMGSLQPRNQVADKRAEPDEERAADSSMVSGRSDPPDDFIVVRMRRSLNNGRTASTSGTSVETISVQSSPPESPVVSPRGEAATTFFACLKRRSVSVSTNSQISTPRERDSHTASRDHGVVLPQKPSVVAWFQRCFRVSHVFGLPSPLKVDSTDRTLIPGISRVATNGSGVVGKIATTAMMMMSSCADGGSNVVSGSGCACVSCG